MMENKHEAYDERQQHRRDRVGKCMFFIVAGTIILLSGLYEVDVLMFSFRTWATVAAGGGMILYFIIMFAMGAFVPAMWNTRRGQIIMALVTIICVAVTAVAILIFEVSALVITMSCFSIALIGLGMRQVRKKR